MKQGTAGDTADKDKFPFFNKTVKTWLYIIWDDEPKDWVLLFLDKRIDEYENVMQEVSSDKRLLLRDITEVYLELAPSTSFRVYLSASQGDTGLVESQDALVSEVDIADELELGGVRISDHASNTDSNTAHSTDAAVSSAAAANAGTAPVVLKITPQPSVRGHAAMWVDALYAAMQLQCFESEEEVRTIQFRHRALRNKIRSTFCRFFFISCHFLYVFSSHRLLCD